MLLERQLSKLNASQEFFKIGVSVLELALELWGMADFWGMLFVENFARENKCVFQNLEGSLGFRDMGEKLRVIVGRSVGDLGDLNI